MSKNLYILLLVVLGFFMSPTTAMACNQKGEMTCCAKKSTAKKEKKDCCSKKQSSKKESHDGCNGACKNITCGGSFVYLGMTNGIQLEFNNPLFDFSTKKQNFYYSNIFVSSGYKSIWLPPKIA